MNRHGEIVIRIHQPDRGRNDTVAVDIGVVAEGNRKAVLEADQTGHRIRAGAIHADLAVVIQRHEGKRRIHRRIDDLDVESVGLGDA